MNGEHMTEETGPEGDGQGSDSPRVSTLLSCFGCFLMAVIAVATAYLMAAGVMWTIDVVRR